jgi:hypothetical protein
LIIIKVREKENELWCHTSCARHPSDLHGLEPGRNPKKSDVIMLFSS